jgi:uncharacterized protein YihD (DUF1040 family)
MRVACLDSNNNIINMIEVIDLNSIPDYIGVDGNNNPIHKNQAVNFVEIPDVIQPDPNNTYVWLDEKGNLQTQYIQALAPKNALKVNNYGYSNLPLDILITVANGTITQNTEQQVLQILQKQKLQQLANYVGKLLQPTDYIIIKISEAQATNDNTLQALQTKYAPQLQQRASIRQWNENTKQAINNTTAIDQLRAINIQFTQ